MKVALFDNVCGCGAWKYNLALSRELAKRGVDLTLITSTEYPQHVAAEQFRALRPLPCLRMIEGNLAKGTRYFSGMVRTAFLLLKGRYDLIHWQLFYALPPLEAALSWVLRLTGQRVVLTVHDVQPWQAVSGRSDMFIKAIYRNAAQLIVHHEVNKTALVDRYGIAPDTVHVVPHGSYLDFSREAGPGTAADTILFFGQIKAEKGLDVLIDAMPAILKRRPRTRLIIAGRPWRVDPDAFLAQIERLGIRDHVTCRFEFVPDEELEELFARASAIALPYRDITQSGVVIQAMSSGRPVVASDVGALGETVRAAECGIVVPPGDSAALAEALLTLLNDPAQAEAMGRRGREAASAGHDWGRSAEATLAAYAELDGVPGRWQ